MATRTLVHNAVVVDGTHRFSLLSSGLVRMEYSPSGRFEDRRSVRAASRPDPAAFAEVREDKDGLHLVVPATGPDSTGSWEIVFCPGGGGFSEQRLAARMCSTGQEIWNPGRKDLLNLGASHVSSDQVKPGTIPHGVHVATTEYHQVSSSDNLWAVFDRLPKDSSGRPDPRLDNATLVDEVLATISDDVMTPSLRKLVFERSKYPPGLLSRSGYFLFNDSATPLFNERDWVEERPGEDGYVDWYLFCYGRDFKRALRDYRLLFGAVPLIPRYVLGLWYSRFPTFPEDEMRRTVESFESYGAPLDVLVLDLEWHMRGWHGFDWNPHTIQDPAAFVDYLRQRKVHVTMNVHPDAVPADDSRFGQFVQEAGVEPAGLHDRLEHDDFDKTLKFRGFDVSREDHATAFLDVLHKPVQDQGIDFWWIDGHAPVERCANIDPLFWTSYVYQKHMKVNYSHQRPIILTRYAGVGSHRFPLFFTGDAWSYFEVLASLVEQTLRAGHVSESWISHDIGGHFSSFEMIDPELYIRWVQFGALSPILRLHSSRLAEGVGGERRPWVYGDKVLAAFLSAVRVRSTLLPYLYTLAWQSAQTGLPICRSNCIERPEWEAGYSEWTSYFLGDRIYAAPIVSPGTIRSVTLPPGDWYNSLTGRLYRSDGISPITQVAPFDAGPLHYYSAGTVMVKQVHSLQASRIPDDLVLEIYAGDPGSQNSFILYEDDGLSRAHERGARATTTFRMSQYADRIELEVESRRGVFDGAPLQRSYIVRVFGTRVVRCLVDDNETPVCGDTDLSNVEAGGGVNADSQFRTGSLDVRDPHRVVLLV